MAPAGARAADRASPTASRSSLYGPRRLGASHPARRTTSSRCASRTTSRALAASTRRSTERDVVARRAVDPRGLARRLLELGLEPDDPPEDDVADDRQRAAGEPVAVEVRRADDARGLLQRARDRLGGLRRRRGRAAPSAASRRTRRGHASRPTALVELYLAYARRRARRLRPHVFTPHGGAAAGRCDAAGGPRPGRLHLPRPRPLGRRRSSAARRGWSSAPAPSRRRSSSGSGSSRSARFGSCGRRST